GAEARSLGDLQHQRQVAQQERRLGQHRAGVRRVPQRLPDALHQPVAPLHPLVGIGVRPQRDVLPAPGGTSELGAQHLGRVHLHHDLALEVSARVEIQVSVRRAGEAVAARVRASPVRVHGPAKRHSRGLWHAVQRRLRPHLVEARLEGIRRLEATHDRLFAVTGQAPLLVLAQRQVAPAHEHMFAYAPAPSPAVTYQCGSEARSAAGAGQQAPSPISVWLVADWISTGVSSPAAARPVKFTTLLWRVRPRWRSGSVREGPSTSTSSVRPTKRWARSRARRWTSSTRRRMRSTLTWWDPSPSPIAPASVPRRGEKMNVKAPS